MDAQIIDEQYLKPSSLEQLHKLYEKDPTLIIGKQTKFYGWIRRVRIGGAGTIAFIDVYDGTKVGVLVCVALSESYVGESYEDPHKDDELTDHGSFQTLSFDQLSKTEFISNGCAVVVDGIITKSSDDAIQVFEIVVSRLRVIGKVEDPVTYPIQKSTERQVALLRKLPFMRIRSQVMQSIFRICSKLELAVHMFMDEQGVQKVDPNIITMSDCEGAGETFAISPLMFSKDSQGQDIPVGLTVSSQLPLESSICGLRSVYTAQKSFRAEKSDTNKHLAEFLHIEYESSFIRLDQLMEFTEQFIKYIIKFTFSRCKEDFDFLESKFAPSDIVPSRGLLTELLDKPFVRIKHRDAIELIQKLVAEKFMLPDENGKMKRVKLDKLPQQGEDIGSEHEKLLVKYFGWMSYTEEERQAKLASGGEFGAFVFLTHWPLKIKSFYMKQCDDGLGECESFDLLAPRVGELVGGSMRENSFEKLDAEVKRRGMNVSPIQWFLDL